jgi:hypothetical protein
MAVATLTRAQVDEAIAQMIVDCELREQTYEMTSARESMIRLGYGPTEQEQVLLVIASRGFDYCLDPAIAQKRMHGNEFPSYAACVWGPDQLKSRLECVTR